MPEWNIPVIKRELEVLIHDVKSPLDLKEVRRYLKKILEVLPELKRFYWSVSIISDEQMEKLNFKFTGRNYPTDVLSFFYRDDNVPLAEVIISADQAYENSIRFKTTPAEELLMYLIHGILHIMGYNDSEGKEKKRMLSEQNRLLKEILE